MFTVTFGGWYQRTTLHLSEVYDLMALGHSNLSRLSAKELKDYQHRLQLQSVSRQSDYLEYVQAITTGGIIIHYYEDGLFTLELQSDDIDQARKKLSDYYDRSLHPAISYIFSLGAPTPKVLASIKTQHSSVVIAPLSDIKKAISTNKFGQVYSQIKSAKFSVFKTPGYIFVANLNSDDISRHLVDNQIFFREFKDQLERYLQIHRDIWEEISAIKERRFLAGTEVEPLRSRLDAYQKTINLISSRINQMGSYVHTRASIVKDLGLEKELVDIFQYKFETLTNTHTYIKEIWRMTSDYLGSAIQVLVELRNQSTANGIQSLRLITTVGVLSGIVGYLSRDQFPSITLIGLWYFIVLILTTWLINNIISLVYRHLRYELKFTPTKT